MKRRALIVGAVLIVAAGAAVAQTTTRWVERTKADVRAGKGSFHVPAAPLGVETVLKNLEAEAQFFGPLGERLRPPPEGN